MGTTQQLVSVEEYMHSTYEPDAEFVEGRIITRPMPKVPHSEMQSFLDRTLYQIGHPLGYRVWPELRVRTESDPPHYRVPDICMTKGKPQASDDVAIEPPFLCIEILSPDDSAVELRAKVHEYLSFGVQFVWVIEPVTRTGEIHTSSGIERVDNGRFHAGEIEVDLSGL
jgi:Uma2 family endonuclease